MAALPAHELFQDPRMNLAVTAPWPNPSATAASVVSGDTALREDLGTATGLKLHYQPIVDASGTVVCVEALLRMTRSGVLIPAPQLIEQSRRLGLLPLLGHQVQRIALNEFATHHTLHGFPRRVAINVAAEEFSAPGFAEHVLIQLERCKLAPDQVTLEITEDSPLPHTALVSETMHRLHSAGVRLSLDDFGTGNNGFHALLRMRFQQIKLDKVFVSRLREGDILVGGLIQTAQRMNIEVVCEGVETAEQAAILRDLGCDLFQGYYFGRPGELDLLKRTVP